MRLGLISNLFIRLLLKFKLVNKKYVFGDSHSEVFEYINFKYFPLFNVTKVKGGTAMGLVNPRSNTDCLNIFLNKIEKIEDKSASIYFLLGEVDTGFVIWYRAQKYGLSVEEQMDVSLNNYFDFLNKIKSFGFKNIFIVGVPLPTIQDGQNWGEVANLRKEVEVSLFDRTKLTLEYNSRLNSLAKEYGLSFLNTDNELLDSKTRVIKSVFLNGDTLNHHLDSNSYSKVLLDKIQIF